MDRATVIAALPPVGDRINKISSEPVPHLTLLYLGEVDLSEDAILYVKHACAELSPFGLSVDYRGELGPDKADVLFFENNAWDLERVNEFRHHLLLNDEIKRAFDAADQYPEWTPHLTLGYPEAPAREKPDEDYYMGYVNFDRIVVWMGDFSGPEFRLKYSDDYGLAVSMSEMTTADRGEHAIAELFHRNVPATERKELKKKGAAKPDESFPIANAGDLDSAIKLAKSDSDRRHIIKNAKRLGLESKIPDTWNADGSLEHGEMTTAERGGQAVAELFHYGVKGMKWGVTTKDGATSATQTREKTSHLVRGAKDVQVSQRKAGTYVKAKGGERQKAHDDAVRAQAGRRIAKKSTTDALSNKQLKDTIERMRLEQEYSKLDSKVSRKGQSFIARLFRSPEAKSVAVDLAKKVAKTAAVA